MKTNKKLISILLILVMAVFLFTGCGKKSSGNTTLEGTWRCTGQIYNQKVNGEIVFTDEINFPFTFEGKIVQPYLQFGKDNVFKSIIRETVEGVSELYIESEGTYSVTENKIIITYTDGYSFEMKYKLSGNTLVVTTLTISELENEEREVISSLVKVSDSEVAGAKYPDPDEE